MFKCQSFRAVYCCGVSGVPRALKTKSCIGPLFNVNDPNSRNFWCCILSTLNLSKPPKTLNPKTPNARNIEPRSPPFLCLRFRVQGHEALSSTHRPQSSSFLGFIFRIL